MASISDMQRQLSQLETTLAIYRAAYRNQQRVVRYHSSVREHDDNYFTDRDLTVASLVWHLTESKTQALQFLEHKWASKDRTHKSMYTFYNTRINNDLDELYKHARTTLLEELFWDEDSDNHWQVATYLAEQGLFDWLLQTNKKGLAPPAQQCLEQWVVHFPQLSKGARFHAFLEELVGNETARCNWARSYRQRWMFLYRRMPLQPPLSSNQIAEKAGSTNVQHIKCATPILKCQS
jgi:hypothetical protein